MNHHDIITRLIGPICGEGESNADARRFNYLEQTIELVDRLIFDISQAATDKDSHEASRSKIGQKAQKFLDDLRDSLPANVKGHAPASEGETETSLTEPKNPATSEAEREAGCCVPACSASWFSRAWRKFKDTGERILESLVATNPFM
jgi:hypothetical protein